MALCRATPTRCPPFGDGQASSISPDDTSPSNEARLSHFEHIVTTYPPVLSALIAQLPTRSLFSLYHTSRYLRDYLACYPLAWANLSYRQPKSTVSETVSPWAWSISSGSDSSGETRDFSFMLDKHLRFIVSVSSLLTRLDLDNTVVDGLQLYANVVGPRRATLQHLSIRGCKQVSLKYHVLPFLEMELSLQESGSRAANPPLALKSLYIHRSRHHRKRAYLPVSLLGRDSESRPTHAVIELCHILGIWTDTAWCPSPGRRCIRRKEYGASRTVPPYGEIWVPYDRLWRSQNAIGSRSSLPIGSAERMQGEHHRGRLWEQQEVGWDGEAVGSSTDWPSGEGKDVPMHLRQSHRMFVENLKCTSCQEPIPERCEQCSIRMHCMGCRKILCASCAYDIPLDKRKVPSRHELPPTGNPYVLDSSMTLGRGKKILSPNWWWPEGVLRSPNSLYAGTNERLEPDSDDSDSEADRPADNRVPRLDTRWCCVSPVFSGSGGPVTHSNVYAGNVRSCPLPRGHGFEDPAFRKQIKGKQIKVEHDSDQSKIAISPIGNLEDLSGADLTQMLDPSKDENDLMSSALISPRTLCRECYDSPTWKILCAGCKGPLCYDHDVQLLNVRRCGWRNLLNQRSRIKSQTAAAAAGIEVSKAIVSSTVAWFFSKWTPIVKDMLSSEAVRTWDLRRKLEHDSAYAELKPLKAEKFPCMGSFLRSRTRSGTGEPLNASTSTSTPDLSSVEYPAAEHVTGPQGSDKLTNDSLPTSSLPLQTRPRSLSLPSISRSKIAKPASPNIHRPPTWTGCNRYYCPAPRNNTADRRFHCRGNALSECHTCGTWVCKACALADRLTPTVVGTSSASASSSSTKTHNLTSFALASAFQIPPTDLPAPPKSKPHRPRPRPRPRDPHKPCPCPSCASIFRCPNCRRSKAVLDACHYERQDRARAAQMAAQMDMLRRVNAAATGAAGADADGAAGSAAAGAELYAQSGLQERGLDHYAEWVRRERKLGRESAARGIDALEDFWDGVGVVLSDDEVFRAWLGEFGGWVGAGAGAGGGGADAVANDSVSAAGIHARDDEDWEGLDGLSGFWRAVGGC